MRGVERQSQIYVGGISGLDAPQTFELDLSFLGHEQETHSLTLIQDGEQPRQLTSSSQSVTSADTIRIDLLARGGFVARIVPR